MVLKDIIIKNINIEISLCPYCLGTGKLKAMQSVANFDRGSIRGEDTTVKCEHCNGIGLIK